MLSPSPILLQSILYKSVYAYDCKIMFKLNFAFSEAEVDFVWWLMEVLFEGGNVMCPPRDINAEQVMQ